MRSAFGQMQQFRHRKSKKSVRVGCSNSRMVGRQHLRLVDATPVASVYLPDTTRVGMLGGAGLQVLDSSGRGKLPAMRRQFLGQRRKRSLLTPKGIALEQALHAARRHVQEGDAEHHQHQVQRGHLCM